MKPDFPWAEALSPATVCKMIKLAANQPRSRATVQDNIQAKQTYKKLQNTVEI